MPNPLRHRLTKGDLVSLAILLVAVIGLFAPIIGVQVGKEDFGGHEILVRQMEQAGKPTIPHFLYHGLVIALDKLFPQAGLSLDSLLLLVAFELLLAFTLFWILRREFGAIPGFRSGFVRVIGIIALMIVAPILPMALVTGRLHSGDWNFLAITNYFNPTMILLRPLALLLFYFALPAFEKEPPKIGTAIICAALAILSTLSKPNFAICLLPALCIVALFRFVRHQPIQWKHLILGLLLPLTAVLGWQFWFTYTHGSTSLSESHIIFAPLAMFPWDYIWLRFLLSILFPLLLVILYPRESMKDFPFSLAGIVFIIGAFCTYFLAESGERLKDGNFVWCGQITLFVLFAAAFVFFVKQARMRQNEAAWRIYLCAVIFLLHVASGVAWYSGHISRMLQ